MNSATLEDAGTELGKAVAPQPSPERSKVLCVMLEEAARIQLLAEAVGGTAPEFPAEDVSRLRRNLLSPEQFVVNFAFLAGRAEGGPLPAALATPSTRG